MKSYYLLGVSVALAACGTVTEPVPETALAPSANSDAHVRYATPPALMSGYTKRLVKGPASWRELNDRQAPDQGGS